MKESQEIRADVLRYVVGDMVTTPSTREAMISGDPARVIEALMKFDGKRLKEISKEKVIELTTGEFDLFRGVARFARTTEEFAQGVEKIIEDLSRE